MTTTEIDAAVVWKNAIEAACAEAGANLQITLTPYDEFADYYWAPMPWDTDLVAYWEYCAFAEGPADARWHEVYEIFHRACVLADTLRPAHIRPSAALAERLA